MKKGNNREARYIDTLIHCVDALRCVVDCNESALRRARSEIDGLRKRVQKLEENQVALPAAHSFLKGAIE